MELVFTRHADQVMGMRQIEIDWVLAAVEHPEQRQTDSTDPDLERFYRRIPERENRVLRVIVNTNLAPWRVVSVFFDRGMKGSL